MLSYPMVGRDPIDILLQAFAILYPEKSKLINPYYNWDMKKRKKEFGAIEYCDSREEIKIALCPELSVMQVAETLLVLLAEVVVGKEGTKEEFENVAIHIQRKYVELSGSK